MLSLPVFKRQACGVVPRCSVINNRHTGICPWGQGTPRVDDYSSLTPGQCLCIWSTSTNSRFVLVEVLSPAPANHIKRPDSMGPRKNSAESVQRRRTQCANVSGSGSLWRVLKGGHLGMGWCRERGEQQPLHGERSRTYRRPVVSDHFHAVESRVLNWALFDARSESHKRISLQV